MSLLYVVNAENTADFVRPYSHSDIAPFAGGRALGRRIAGYPGDGPIADFDAPFPAASGWIGS